MSRMVVLRNLGVMAYREAWAVQKAIESRLIEAQSILDYNQAGDGAVLDTLLLVEHPAVYTVGIRSANYTNDSENRLRHLGADFCRADRGGLITFHGPGQLVAYPILDLNRFRPSVKWYVHTLERTIVDTCYNLSVPTETCIHPGVWVGNNKIGAIGIHTKQFVTTHGVALNCNVDLQWYKHIVACGIEGRGLTSLSQELGRDVSVDETVPKFVKAFEENFHCTTVVQD